MVSLSDIARHAKTRSQDGLNKELTRTLASITTPRKPQPQLGAR